RFHAAFAVDAQAGLVAGVAADVPGSVRHGFILDGGGALIDVASGGDLRALVVDGVLGGTVDIAAGGEGIHLAGGAALVGAAFLAAVAQAGTAFGAGGGADGRLATERAGIGAGVALGVGA